MNLMLLFIIFIFILYAHNTLLNLHKFKINLLLNVLINIGELILWYYFMLVHNIGIIQTKKYLWVIIKTAYCSILNCHIPSLHRVAF